MLSASTTGQIIAAIAAFASFAFPLDPPASRDAVNACGATNVTKSAADVDPSIWQAPFLELPGLTIRCGDGRSYGAVKIEVKHNVPNWADAANCIEKIIARATPASRDGKSVYEYVLNDKKWVVSTGRNGLITAFPKDNKAASWIECSQS